MDEDAQGLVTTESSNTGLSIEYALDEFGVGDFERFMCVSLFIRLTADDDVESFLSLLDDDCALVSRKLQ